jgi:hypothetical protein
VRRVDPGARVVWVQGGREADARGTKRWRLGCVRDGGHGGAHAVSVVNVDGDRERTGGGGVEGWRCSGELGPCRGSQCRAVKPIARKGKKTAAAASSSGAPSGSDGEVAPPSPLLLPPIAVLVAWWLCRSVAAERVGCARARGIGLYSHSRSWLAADGGDAIGTRVGRPHLLG